MLLWGVFIGKRSCVDYPWTGTYYYKEQKAQWQIFSYTKPNVPAAVPAVSTLGLENNYISGDRGDASETSYSLT